jgi:hypothetical protein
MLSAWADIAQNVSVILASLFAIYGIDSWRREFVGKRQMELAEEVLALFYQARDIIQAMRSPFGYEGEGATRKPAPSERPEDKDALDRAYALIERYNKHVETFSRIHALRYRFMAQIGVEAAQPFLDLNKVVNDLILASRRMARLSTRPARTLRTEADLEKYDRERNEVEAVFYSGEESDPITPRVDAIIAEIEQTCRGLIESRGTLFALLNRRIK